MMSLDSKICSLLKSLADNDFVSAANYVQEAQEELTLIIDFIGLKLSDNGKDAVEKLSNVIKYIEKKEFKEAQRIPAKGPFIYELKMHLKGARERCIHHKQGVANTNTDVTSNNEKKVSETEAMKKETCKIRQDHVKNHSNVSSGKKEKLEKKTDSQSDPANYLQLSENQHDHQHDQKGLSLHFETMDVKKRNQLSHVTGHQSLQRKTKEGHSDEADKIQGKEKNRNNDNADSRANMSKFASHAMRLNNPDIADLSDINRPTKLAERFSELYDNEWTEAFEVLRKKNLKETDVITYLLLIVQEAYQFCTQTAERQIEEIASAFLNIIINGPDLDQHNVVDKSLIMEGYIFVTQIRKDHAEKTIPRLKQLFMEFMKQNVQPPSRLPANLPALTKYTENVVELSWWMCVQDPPVYMCPTRSESTADKNLYRAYTKSGTEVNYFVWPALRLYKDGGVLMKGVVQYN